MRLSELLREKSRRVIGLPPSASAGEAATLMKVEGVGAVVICDDGGDLRGILSERDLAVALATRGADLPWIPVSGLMTVGGPTADITDSVRDVMRTVTEHRARHVPVLEGERVVGVVSVGDLLKAQLVEKSQENAVLQDIARARIAA